MATLRWFSTVVAVTCLTAPLHSVEAKVLEMSDKFVSLKNEGMWLVMFYAPWCGHCKALEPIWKHVDQSLNSLPVRVGRVDCTRFPSVSTEFDIRGFPTIIFFKGEARYNYEGDRNREDIVAFAKRLVGPAVGQIKSRSDFDAAREKSDLFFLYTGEEEGPLWDEYFHAAGMFQPHEFFYRAPADGFEEKFISGQRESPAVRVYKDSSSFLFDGSFLAVRDRVHRSPPDEPIPASSSSSSNSSFWEWVNRERFPRFVKVTRGRFGHLMSTKKLLAMAVLKENRIGKLTPEMESFRDMVHDVLERNLDRYRPHFQFGWTGLPELANSVAMQKLSLPNMIVVNTTTYQHYLPEDDPEHLTAEALHLFLDQVLEGAARVYGGSSIYVRFYRAYYEITTSIDEMWNGNPTLTSVLFGLPLGFFALICYSICCADIMDAEDDEEEEETMPKMDAAGHQKID